VSPRDLASLAADQRRELVASGRALWRRVEPTLAGGFVEAFVELRAIDRALALASKLFVAILPLSILITALVSGDSFGDDLVARFGLTGDGAAAARELFAAPTQVQAGIGALGVVILVSSILSFSRALERVYLDAWALPVAPFGAARARLEWLVGCIVTVSVSSTANEAVERAGVGALGWLVALAVGGVFFLWTPYVLLGRRVALRTLLPTGLLTGGALLVFAIGSDVMMPDLVTHNTERYGLIGFTFSLVTWLFSGAILVVSAAILGALVERRIVRSG
jgi:membrane protein